MGQNAKREMSLIERTRRRRVAQDLQSRLLQRLSDETVTLRMEPEEAEVLADLLRDAAEAPLAP